MKIPLIIGGALTTIGAGVYLLTRSRTPSKSNPSRSDERILVIGDSLVMSRGSFAEILGAERAGRVGAGTRELAGIAPDAIASARPTLVIVSAGLNDGAGRASATIDNLTRIYRAAQDAGARVVALAETPWRGYSGWSSAAQERHEAVRSWVLRGGGGNLDASLDPYTVLEDARRPGYLADQYASRDQLHLTPAGHRALALALSRHLGLSSS